RDHLLEHAGLEHPEHLPLVDGILAAPLAPNFLDAPSATAVGRSLVHSRRPAAERRSVGSYGGAPERSGALLLGSFEVITQRRSTTMTATTRSLQRIASRASLFLALELGETSWKLAFTTGMGQKPRERTITARDRVALLREITRAQQRFGLRDKAAVASVYE